MGKLADTITAAQRQELFHMTDAGDDTPVVYAPLPKIEGEIARIIAACDPMAFLADVVNGKAIESHVVEKDENGELKVVSYYSTPNLGQRIATARFLTNKYMPNIAVVKHINPPSDDPKPTSRFDQIIDNAANQDV